MARASAPVSEGSKVASGVAAASARAVVADASAGGAAGGGLEHGETEPLGERWHHRDRGPPVARPQELVAHGPGQHDTSRHARAGRRVGEPLAATAGSARR